MSLRKLFQDTSLDELCSPQNIVILKDTATVDQALKVSAAAVHAWQREAVYCHDPILATTPATPNSMHILTCPT